MATDKALALMGGTSTNPGNFGSVAELLGYLQAIGGVTKAPSQQQASQPPKVYPGTSRQAAQEYADYQPMTGGLNVQNSMMAGNTAAQHGNIITPILPSVYSSMGTGMSNLSPGEQYRLGQTRSNLDGKDAGTRANQLSQANLDWIARTHGRPAAVGSRTNVTTSTGTGGDPALTAALESPAAQKAMDDLAPKFAEIDALVKSRKISRAEAERRRNELTTQMQQQLRESAAANTNSPALQAAIDAAKQFGGTASGAVDTTSQAGTGGTGTTTDETANTAAQDALVNRLAESTQSAYDEARQREDERFQEGKEGYAERTDTALNLLEGLGAQQLADTNRRYDQMQGSVAQNAISRGLYNTTVLDAMQRGVEEDRNRAVAQTNEALTREKLNTYGQYTGDQLGFLERPNMAYPDVNSIYNMAAGVGSAGGNVAVPTAPPAANPSPTAANANAPAPNPTPAPLPVPAPMGAGDQQRKAPKGANYAAYSNS